MKWEILILTQPSRAKFLEQLLNLLWRQTNNRDVGVQTRMFDRRMPLGENREVLRRESQADYISFLDDDDLVPGDYVAKILPLLDGIDQVGHKLICYIDGRPLPMCYHSLKYDKWWHNHEGYYRDISHLNPMRRDLAMLTPMSGPIGEDHRWADAMRALGVVKTEHFLDEVMYFYYSRSNKNDAVDAVAPQRLQVLDTLMGSAV